MHDEIEKFWAEIDELDALATKATGNFWEIQEHGDAYALFAYNYENGKLEDPDSVFGAIYEHGYNLFYVENPDWNWNSNRDYIKKVGPIQIQRMIAALRVYRELERQWQHTEQQRAEDYDRIRRICSKSKSDDNDRGGT